MKIYCNRCGVVEETIASSGGVCDIGGKIVSLYGHHYCPDGGMGLFISPPKEGRKEGRNEKED